MYSHSIPIPKLYLTHNSLALVVKRRAAKKSRERQPKKKTRAARGSNKVRIALFELFIEGGSTRYRNLNNNEQMNKLRG